MWHWHTSIVYSFLLTSPWECWFIAEACRTVHVCGKLIILFCTYARVYKLSHFKMSFTWCSFYARRTRNIFSFYHFTVREKDRTSSISLKNWIGEVEVEIRLTWTALTEIFSGFTRYLQGNSRITLYLEEGAATASFHIIPISLFIVTRYFGAV